MNNIKAALLRMGAVIIAERERKYKLMGECIRLSAQIEGIRHTAESFEEHCKCLESSEPDVLEAMIHAYNLRISDQFPAAEAPTVENLPEVTAIHACAMKDYFLN